MRPGKGESAAISNPKNWVVDIATDYITFRPTDLDRSLGFHVSIQLRDFSADRLSPDDFVAELMHWPASGEIPCEPELTRLCRIAAYLFAIHFLARLEKRIADDLHHRSINEDSTHDLETNVHVV